MTHAFTNYNQFRDIKGIQQVTYPNGIEASIKVCSPDPFNQETIRTGATWGLMVWKRGICGSLIIGYKWFREDGTPVEGGSPLQGRMIDNVLRLLNK